MESLKFNEDLENFLAELEFPSCETHQKLRTEFICLDFDCPNFKIPFCSLCFKKVHYETKHPQIEIRNLLTFLLTNQDRILNKESILKTIPFFQSIDDKLIAIHKRIEELQKAKDKIIEMRVFVNERLENYPSDNRDIRGAIEREITSKKRFEQLLGFLVNSLEKVDGVITFKNAEFSNDEIKTFDEIMDFENSFVERVLQQKAPIVVIHTVQGDEEIGFKFDEKAKADGIVLLNNQKIAKREEYSKSEQRFCLITPKLVASSKITLRVSGLQNWVGVGVVKNEFIRKNSLQFLYKQGNFERGHYMISHKGYAWSDFDDNEHHRATAFEFEAGDVLELTYDQQKRVIEFENRSKAKNKSLKLFELKDDNYVFAVALLGPGDSVEIMG